ncbi:MAG: 16S rRNA (uracil(1498)-N(3))-methyltransferase, partial [Nitrospirota bacterium]|nr:16S rRNA (uracil(1498)-N(3))-methyltransferase [Nitrospirota bacterium]
MNLILFDRSDHYQDSGRIRLSDHRFQHISKVLRSKKDDLLKVGRINGDMGTGKIIEITGQYAELSVCLDRKPPLPSPLSLVLALPRPKVLKRTLKHITVLGVKKIYLVNSFRVEKSYWQTPLLQQDSIRNIFLNSLEQACDTVLPELYLRPLFRPFVEDELPGIIKDTAALVAHPGTASGVTDISGKHITLAIGPEGGFIPYEIEKLKE